MFLSKEDYKIAEKNGISKEILEHRFYDKSWEAVKARSQKISIQKPVKKLYEQAIKNGLDVKYQTIASRYRAGWDEKDITTVATRGRRDLSQSKRQIEIAEKNGINYSAYYSRLARGWSVEDAITIPLEKYKERVKGWVKHCHICDGKRVIYIKYGEESEWEKLNLDFTVI